MAEITPLPNGGTWIIAEVVAPPIDELDPLPNGGTWIIAQADPPRSGFRLGSLRFGSRPGF